jgi:hypothetical protein
MSPSGSMTKTTTRYEKDHVDVYSLTELDFNQHLHLEFGQFPV